MTGVTQLAAGPSHSCAALSSGEARCWGSDDVGQIGDGAVAYSGWGTLKRLVPTAVKAPIA